MSSRQLPSRGSLLERDDALAALRCAFGGRAGTGGIVFVAARPVSGRRRSSVASARASRVARASSWVRATRSSLPVRSGRSSTSPAGGAAAPTTSSRAARARTRSARRAGELRRKPDRARRSRTFTGRTRRHSMCSGCSAGGSSTAGARDRDLPRRRARRTHPLRVDARGARDAARSHAHRLEPLSQPAVAELAERRRRSCRALSAHRGNPFFVTEVLEAQAAGSRRRCVTRCSPARPGSAPRSGPRSRRGRTPQAEPWLLEGLTERDRRGRRVPGPGMLDGRGGVDVSARARANRDRAGASPVRRRALHRQVLAALGAARGAARPRPTRAPRGGGG